jgi:hypothetical protein
MATLNHLPHVTLAVYDSIPERQLSGALRSVFGSHPQIRLRFSKLAFFETPELVCWAAPDRSEALLHAHAAIHELIDPRCVAITTGFPLHAGKIDVSADNKEEVIALAAETIEPFEVLDKAVRRVLSDPNNRGVLSVIERA